MTEDKEKDITLAYIQERKAQLRQEMTTEKNVIREKVSQIFSPPPPATTKWGMMAGVISNGMAIYDGVKIGWSIIQHVRRLFKK